MRKTPIIYFLFLLIFTDFYNTSEFRDLLFHNQETQYSLPEIEQALNQLDLQFIALFVGQEKQSVFRREYPNGNIHDLALWHQLELKNPQLFSSMYAFWCQKKT